jgi:hypothetical protein
MIPFSEDCSIRSNHETHEGHERNPNCFVYFVHFVVHLSFMNEVLTSNELIH